MRSYAALALAVGATLFLSAVVILLSIAVGDAAADRMDPLMPGRGVTIPAPGPSGGVG